MLQLYHVRRCRAGRGWGGPDPRPPTPSLVTDAENGCLLGARGWVVCAELECRTDKSTRALTRKPSQPHSPTQSQPAHTQCVRSRTQQNTRARPEHISSSLAHFTFLLMPVPSSPVHVCGWGMNRPAPIPGFLHFKRRSSASAAIVCTLCLHLDCSGEC